jgi:hypothetical protein
MSDEVVTLPFNREDRWYVRVGATAPVGPVGTALLLKGIAAGRVPEDAWIRKEGELGWNLWPEVPLIRAAIRGEPLETERDVERSSSGMMRSGQNIPSVPTSKMRPSLSPPVEVDAGPPSSRELHDFLATPPPQSVRVPNKGSASELLASATPSSEPLLPAAPTTERLPSAIIRVSSDVRSAKTDPPGRVTGQAIGHVSGRVISAQTASQMASQVASPELHASPAPIATLPSPALARSPWPSAAPPINLPAAASHNRSYHRALPVFVITLFALVGAVIMLLLLRHRPW